MLTPNPKNHANAETTVMIEYGMSTIVRRLFRGMTILCIVMAITMPSTSSATTVTTVMNSVTPVACQNTGSVRATM